MWYGGASLASARWAGENGVNFLTSSVVRAEESDDFATIQRSHIRAFRAAHEAGAAARVSQGLVVIPTDSASAAQRAKYEAYVAARTPRTEAPVGPARMLFARDILGPSEEIAAALYQHAGFREVTEVAFALPFTFSREDYAQILTDMATKLGPALGWAPEGLADPEGRALTRLLIVHHTTSPALQAMLEAVVAGARDPELEGIDVAVAPALAATASDVLAADGFLLGTPANIGYMSGALKHFFDQIYYPCLQAKTGAPYGLYVHGASDTTGAVRAVTAIAKGLGWAQAFSPVETTGPVGKDVERRCYELGATVAANLSRSPRRASRKRRWRAGRPRGQRRQAAARALPASAAAACAASLNWPASSLKSSSAGLTPTRVNSRSTSVRSAPHTSAMMRRR